VRLILLILAGSGLLAAQDLPTRLDRAVKEMTQDNTKFMGTVLVARDGQVLLSRGYGFANLEWEIANTPDTKFRLGSISKQFTAACILLLEERGKLKVTDLVKQHLGDTPPAWDKITIHQVLSHTSGIPSITEFPEFGTMKRRTMTLEQTYRVYSAKPLEFDPGTRWKYSNSGYLLLSHLVEKVSGQRYEDFLTANILGPAGMHDSGYDLSSRILKHRAAGYTPFGNLILNADFVDMTIPSGAGALYSTTGDLLRWEQALFGGRIVSAESLRKMTTPVMHDYGYGLFVAVRNKHKRIEHSGGIEGFNTHLAWLPDDKLVVVVLANLNGNAPNRIADRLSALIFEEGGK
jgi:CubicO group peptidase (beta-lactamase class C family)